MPVLLIGFTFAGLVAGCSLYKVKPLVKLPAMPEAAGTADLGSISFRVAPLLTDEESQELFEANLPLSGLLPLRVEIVHNSGAPVDLRRVRFGLRDSAGSEWKFVSSKSAISRILKTNGIYLYNPRSRQTFEKEFRAYELDLQPPLTHAERRRQGFVFFQAPKKEAVASPRGLVLSVQGLPQALEMRLN